MTRKEQDILNKDISNVSKQVMLEIKDLYKSFEENKVLNGFNLKLYEGENLVIMGKSGSGKSVMIKCLIGLMKPDSGDINIMGRDISKLNQTELDELRTEVGFLFQGSALYDSMTVRENLEFPLRRHKKKFGEIKDTSERVLEALESVGLAHTINLMPSELSGGMKRRVALARTLILKPKIILYDEPTSGLDNDTLEYLSSWLQTTKKQWIITTHQPDVFDTLNAKRINLDSCT